MKRYQSVMFKIVGDSARFTRIAIAIRLAPAKTTSNDIQTLKGSIAAMHGDAISGLALQRLASASFDGRWRGVMNDFSGATSMLTRAIDDGDGSMATKGTNELLAAIQAMAQLGSTLPLSTV